MSRRLPAPTLLSAALLLILASASLARDNGQWAQVPPERRDWFRRQTIPDAARQRLGVPYTSCCDHADVFRTRFRVGAAGQDVWEYLDDGRWKLIPPDIISEQPSLDGEPILFRRASDGEPLCFFKPNGGT